jgi:crossover junction endodeoxyribonuclease RusA
LQEALRQTTKQKYSFFVAGEPASQGSKRAIGRIIAGPDGRPRAVANMIEQDEKLKPWRHSIGQMGKLMLPKGWEMTGFFTLGVVFFLPRPKSHYASHGGLKASAPFFHSSRKDCDKMVRAVGDALTGVCYDDDSMIASITALKVYQTREHAPGAWIAIGRLDEQPASAAVGVLID